MKLQLSVLLLCCSCLVYAQSPVGIFENHSDIGNPKKAGSTSYDAGAQVYNLKGAGYNIWFGRDELQYAYKKIAGDFVLTANFEFVGKDLEQVCRGCRW